MALITVIVPCFNVENHLKRCLDSILSQSFSDFKVFLINDGSTDSTSQICQKYKELDKRIIYINQENKGISETRNIGLSGVDTKYFCFIDSDDFAEKTYLGDLFSESEKNNSDLTSCDFTELTNVSTVKKQSIENNSISNIQSLLSRKTQSCLWNKLFRTDIQKQNNIHFPVNLCIGEDYIFLLKFYFYSNNFSYVNKSLYNYNRTNQNSITSILKERKINQLTTLSSMISDFLLQNNLIDRCRNEYIESRTDHFFELIMNSSYSKFLKLKKEFKVSSKDVYKSKLFSVHHNKIICWMCSIHLVWLGFLLKNFYASMRKIKWQNKKLKF